MKKQSQGSKLIEKALSKPTVLKKAAKKLAYGLYYNDCTDLEGEEACIIMQELKANKKAIIDSSAYKTAIKKIAIMAEKELISRIKAESVCYERNLKNKTIRLKTEMQQEAFMQGAAKKLNKKEFEQLKKLLQDE